ncbi:glycosyltransferase [Nocardioides bruguierae]|uniref:Glycosyltransferase family 2 protein n=1 Tax=Nocardioides bruguierae TaxID=2945102 RepID=A0A9X2D783_9ACTN|nr:glycosyltransferase family 2 protein [Nocardioides bruguierae]MCM0619379.1 glycosyltransferase family 2 protein [Nocardioides bruguierae]
MSAAGETTRPDEAGGATRAAARSHGADVGGAGEVGAVGVIVVSHDGERWLPTVIDALRGQSRPADQVVCVDTGSRDGSAELLEAAFGPVARLPRETGYPDAVRRGLAMLADEVDWVWLLHDDSAPEADALLALTLGTQDFPEADLLGCKHREFPSLRRLLEVGVTITGTGRRETGLERGEYDQGQHDDARRVLAVNTAGLLVRRSVLEELGGLDPRLPVFGSDIDLGWRAAARGHTTVVVPQAVVFHAEASHRGLRRTPLTGRHTHFAERRAALYVLLANSRGGWRLPFHLVRLTLGTLLRMLGFLLLRSPGEALDELAALLATVAQPRIMRAAHKERRAAATAPAGQVRSLLPPWWLPYRQGLDLVADLLAALFSSAADVAERRREAAAAADPSSFAARRLAAERAAAEAEEGDVGADTGAVARFLSNPVAVALTVLVLSLLVASRDAWGTVVGGGLAPAPDTLGGWWQVWTESVHDVGSASDVPAPALVGPLLWLGAVLAASPALAVSAVMVLAAPVALLGAWRFLRVTGRLVRPRGLPRPLLLVGSAAWALVPAWSGAWGDGRLGAVLAGALLPWLAHAALGFADPEADRRWRAAWRTGLLLAVVTAGAPSTWLVALLLVVGLFAVGLRLAPSLVRAASVWGPVLVALAVPLAVLLPWWLPTLVQVGPAALVLDPGVQPSPAPSGLDLLAGRLTADGWPLAAGLVLPVLALAALLPRRTRAAVAGAWAVALAATVVALVLSLVQVPLAGGTTPAGVAGPLLVLQAALVVAAGLGALGALLDREETADGGLRHRLVAAGAGLAAVVAALVPLAGLGWFLAGPDALGEEPASVVPAYMVVLDNDGQVPTVLVLRGSLADGLVYEVRRGGTATLGRSEVAALQQPDDALTDVVTSLVSRPTTEDVTALGDLGITYVVLSAVDDTGTRADRRVASVLDAAPGLTQASTEGRTTRAWRVEEVSGVDAPVAATSTGRQVLVWLGAAGVVVALLGSAPSRPGSRQSSSRVTGRGRRAQALGDGATTADEATTGTRGTQA